MGVFFGRRTLPLDPMADVLQTNSVGDARGFVRAARRWGLRRGGFAWRRVKRAAAEGVRRCADILFAASMLSLLSVVVLPLLVWRTCYGWPLATEARLGKRRRLFPMWRIELGQSRFAEWLRRWNVDRSLVCLNVLGGQMTLVGPRAVAVDEPGLLDAGGRRFLVKPGLVCLWWIRVRANIAFGAEWAADHEYVASRSLRGDFGILLRAIVAGLYGTRRGETAERIALFDLPIANVSMDEAVRRMVAQLDAPEPRRVCFVNADCVNLSFRNEAYRACLARSWMNLADGIGMKLAGRAFGRDIRENICGTDLFLFLCERLAGTGKSWYLLGAKPGVVDDLVAWMRKRYPETRVAGSRNGYFSAEEEPRVIADIAASGADVLLVAFGAPRQDLWVAENLAATGVKLAMGVGGLFDYYSGRVPRAPQWMREIGMEWAFRLGQEPRRLWRRYVVGNVVFLGRLAWWRVRGARGSGRGVRDSGNSVSHP
jgi:N-acetylglucosaminyldiphosphoundecaprenol N-acetyl-beta-D-mannosaminyltransferase